MRKFSTSLFIALLALLALPERVWAEDVYLLTAETIKGTKGDYNNPPSQHQFTNTSGTVYTYTFSRDEASGDIFFRISVSDWVNNMQPAKNDDPLTINGDPYSITNDCYGKNTAWKLALDNTKYSSYTITVDIGSTKYVKVTGVESGTATTYNLVYLVDKTHNGKQLHTWLDEDGDNDYPLTVWGSRPTIGTGDFTTTIYNNKEYYTKTFSVAKTTADSYKQIGAKIGDNGANLTSNVITSTWDNVQYIIVTESSVTIVENTAPMYTVTVLSANTDMGEVSPASVSVNAATSKTVTATAKSGYEFVNWTASDGVSVANALVATTTVKATKNGTLIANFKEKSTPDPTPTPTPILGNNFYLVGNFLNTDNGINYACRYFKLSETAATAAIDGVEEYSINIPTTLAVNVQILATGENGSALYGPSGVVTINKSNPSESDDSTTGTLVAATETPTNYFKFEDRTTGRTTETPDANDGLYTITVTVTNGVPANYTISHNPLARVAYYLPNTTDASVKESLNTRSQTTTDFNYVFFGRVYLPAGVACYVLSNYLGNYDYDAKTDTKKKLYLQGNTSGGNPDAGADGDTKVYPITMDNGTKTDAKPFVFSETDIVAMNLEYNPRRGHGNYKAENITGEVLRSKKTTLADDGTSITVPTIEVLKMVGPAVGDDTWDYNNGVVMDYNMAEQCWEATINTYAAAGAKFRFVANNTWGNSWQENGTEDKDKAKIPYTDADPAKGHAATAADPNEVSYIELTSADVRDKDYDIIFNRDPGKWRVRFYFTSQQIDENNYKYIFKYTINGYKSVLRTYCSSVAQKPKADSNIKVYGAYAFDGDEDTKTGTIMLYEMNYIPAKEGVILYSTNTIEDATIGTVMESYTPTEDVTKYKNKNLDVNYKNYLVGTLVDTEVNASEFEGEERTHRNFFFNYLKNTGYYKQGDTDYLGFFRIKSGKTCRANHAYLSLPTDVLAWNGQTFGQVMDEFEANREQQASLTKGMRIVFSDGSDWEDNTTTAISVVQQAKPADNAYYTLQGVRVAAPAKGIYIHNGKKIIIR